jgi:hypothetical protein
VAGRLDGFYAPDVDQGIKVRGTEAHVLRNLVVRHSFFQHKAPYVGHRHAEVGDGSVYIGRSLIGWSGMSGADVK